MLYTLIGLKLNLVKSWIATVLKYQLNQHQQKHPNPSLRIPNHTNTNKKTITHFQIPTLSFQLVRMKFPTNATPIMSIHGDAIAMTGRIGATGGKRNPSFTLEWSLILVWSQHWIAHNVAVLKNQSNSASKMKAEHSHQLMYHHNHANKGLRQTIFIFCIINKTSIIKYCCCIR